MQPLQDFLTPPPPTPTLPPVAAPVADVTATPIPTLPAGPVGSTPLPGAPPAATQPAGTGATQTNEAAILALAIYLAFFGWMGYRRGAQRELTVFVVALGFSFLLQQFSSSVVTLFDRIGKGLAFLTGQTIPEQSNLGIWAANNTTTLLLLLWLIVIVITYLLSSRFVRKSKKDGWAAILGVLNGLVFASIFAPLLTSLIFPNVTLQGPAIQLPVLTFVGNVWQQVRGLIVRLWDVIQPVATNVFFISVILLILLAAFTLRTSVKPKS